MPRLTTLRSRVQMLQPARRAPTATVRTRGSAWVKIRTRIMKRDCGLCQTCKRAGKLAAALEVDHITPLHLGGTDDDSNLEAICLPCHETKTAGEAASRAGHAPDAIAAPPRR